MSRFQFPLQRLLDLRLLRERALARELAHARDAAAAERRQLDSLLAAQSEARASVAREADGGIEAGTLVSLDLVLRHLGEHVDAADERERAAHAVVVERHDALSGALQARRLLERLRVRHLDRHRAETNSKERQFMDAIAITQFVRQEGDDTAGPAGESP